MSSQNLRPTPTSDAELIRQFERRIKNLERSSTARVGRWVLSESDDGRLLATAPGESTQDVGNPVSDEIDLTALRGYVSPGDIANAVSGGKTSDLSAATNVQIGKDVATDNAQYTAENAYTIAAKVEAALSAGDTGYAWSDTFNGPASTTSIGDRYVRAYDGGGAGEYGLNGLGEIAMRSMNGAAPHRWYDLHDTPTNTDKQLLSTVLTAPPRLGGGLGNYDSDFRMVGRWDGSIISGAPGNAVMAYWIGNTAFIGFYDTGVWTQLGATSVGQADGDKWDFQVGTDIDPYQFILLRNNLPVVNVTDPGHASMLGPTYRQGGLGYTAGTVTFVWITQQVEAPSAQTFNFADRSVGF